MKSEWKTLVDDERGVLKVEFNSGMVFLHVVLRLPMEGIRAIRRELPAFKDVLRALGYKKMHVAIPEGDEKLYQFEKMFGFNEVKRAKGQILMVQEC